MAAFGPYTQRTVFAVITASALGSGCYAWMARSGGLTGRSPTVGSSSNAKSVLGGAWRARCVLACRAQPNRTPSACFDPSRDAPLEGAVQLPAAAAANCPEYVHRVQTVSSVGVSVCGNAFINHHHFVCVCCPHSAEHLDRGVLCALLRGRSVYPWRPGMD